MQGSNKHVFLQCVVDLLYCDAVCIGLVAITNLPVIVVFVEYLRQFLIDLNQMYKHSSVPKNTSP